MLSKSSNTQSFQEVLADLRTTCIGTGLPSPAEILHERNLTTRVQAEIDIEAICSVLQERQLKMCWIMTQVGEPRRQGRWWWVKGAMS